MDPRDDRGPAEPLHPIVRLRLAIVVLLVALCAWLLPGLGGLQEDNDVLAFLPPDHPEVINFHAIAERFGMLEIGLVGLARGELAGDDLLSLEAVDAVRDLAKELGELDGVKVVLSFTDLPHPVVHEDGLEVAPLVPESLRDPEELRARVLGSRDAVGNLIAADGQAAALMVFLLHEPTRDLERRATRLAAIRERARSRWPGEVHFTGAPFIEEDAALASRADIVRLSPVVIGVLVVISAVLLGSLVAALLNVLVTGLGVGLVVGAHGVLGEPLTIVSSSIPVMMVALGGAFGVHMLAGYQRQSGESRQRASAALRELARPVLLSGLTTAVAFFALLAMPQVPMQRFGVAAGLGVLVLLALALVVMPALLALLPTAWIRSRPERAMPLRWRPPLGVLVALAIGGGILSVGMEADPDTGNVFAADSEPRRASAFFDQHFGGSTFLQITAEAPLGEAIVLRELREISERIAAIDGVVDVRSVVEPIAVLNHALGGRRGIPETAPRAGRVLTYLIGHPALKQLMTDDGDGALIHIKLAPLSGDRQVAVTAAVREILAGYNVDGGDVDGDTIYAAPTTTAAAREAQRADVQARLTRLLGHPVDPAALADDGALAPTPALRQALTELRDRALDSEDSPVEGVPQEELQALDPLALITPRGPELEALLRRTLPTLAESDPEGIAFAAKFLGAWIDEELVKQRAQGRCAALGLASEERCDALQPALSELADAEWRVTEADVSGARAIPLRLRLTGQPVIGQAFAESVRTSLLHSTLASVLGLGLVLLVARQLFALLPALWTLAVTMGILGFLGVPISVGTSMVACIAVGAGVDFAIHLLARARRHPATGAGAGSFATAGEAAVHEIGAVILISAVQLAAAFLVLLDSGMAPLRDLGLGLAIGLLGAGLGACWLVPLIGRWRPKNT